MSSIQGNSRNTAKQIQERLDEADRALAETSMTYKTVQAVERVFSMETEGISVTANTIPEGYLTKKKSLLVEVDRKISQGMKWGFLWKVASAIKNFFMSGCNWDKAVSTPHLLFRALPLFEKKEFLNRMDNEISLEVLTKIRLISSYVKFDVFDFLDPYKDVIDEILSEIAVLEKDNTNANAEEKNEILELKDHANSLFYKIITPSFNTINLIKGNVIQEKEQRFLNDELKKAINSLEEKQKYSGITLDNFIKWNDQDGAIKPQLYELYNIVLLNFSTSLTECKTEQELNKRLRACFRFCMIGFSSFKEADFSKCLGLIEDFVNCYQRCQDSLAISERR